MDSFTSSNASPDAITLPAAFPPPGVTSNFLNPVSREKDLIVTCVICITLMTICVIVRFYTKLYIKHAWGWDDWLCIPSIIGALGFAGTALSTLGEGVGPHQWDVPFTAFTPSLLRRFVVLDMLYSPTVLLIKFSLLNLYLRVFGPNAKLRYCIYFTMAFLLLFYTGTFIAYAVLSIPRQGQSALQSILSVDTARDIPLGITQGAVNVASDFYIFCLPIPVVWKLQLPPQRKLGMLATFMTGLLACIASTFGLYYRAKLGRNSDVTWMLVFVLLWVVVELTVGIMCSCLPSFPGFFRYHLPQLRALLSLFNTSLKYLHVPFSKHGQSSSSTSSNAKRLATRDIKITLGSRVDGKGLFLNPNSVFAAEQDGEAHHLSNFDTRSDATRREYYEQPEVPQPEPCHDEQHSSQGNTWGSSKDSTIEGPQRDVEPSSPDRPRWWKRSFSSRYGYWDITSFFGTRGTEGSLPSKMHSESKDSKDRKG